MILINTSEIIDVPNALPNALPNYLNVVPTSVPFDGTTEFQYTRGTKTWKRTNSENTNAMWTSCRETQELVIVEL